MWVGLWVNTRWVCVPLDRLFHRPVPSLLHPLLCPGTADARQRSRHPPTGLGPLGSFSLLLRSAGPQIPGLSFQVLVFNWQILLVFCFSLQCFTVAPDSLMSVKWNYSDVALLNRKPAIPNLSTALIFYTYQSKVKLAINYQENN